ncbi:sensor histidine kinase [Telmatobacter bradus]|uniref:sensor histidine kinase n=1 Tax=Telmatobacter bradus TaxID=474953 RepID=UPI003B43AD07
MRATVSLRLTLWYVSIFLGGWMLFGAAMWLNLYQTLTSERRTTLERRFDRLQAVLQSGESEDAEQQYEDFKEFAHATGNGLAEVFRTDGSRALPSPSAMARSFPWPSLQGDCKEQFVQVQAAEQPYWVLVRCLNWQQKTVFVAVAAPATGNNLVLNRFWIGLLASAPVLLFISAAGGYWVSRRALQPVDRITATARFISIRNLSQRLAVPDSGDELERLAATFNAMLERIEAAVNQIKQFTGDASHELRGPLSFVRTVAEVALRNPQIDAESRQAFQEIVEEMATASVLLEDMLTLARGDTSREGLPLVRLDLRTVLESALELAAPVAAERGLTLNKALPQQDALEVMGDASSLRRLFWILLDNALKFTERSGLIEIHAEMVQGTAVIEVRDHGVGIGASDLSHIFDRFFRADPSRAQTEGSGLGLAIAKWIADMHGATLTVSSVLQQGTTVRMVFPRAQSQST